MFSTCVFILFWSEASHFLSRCDREHTHCPRHSAATGAGKYYKVNAIVQNINSMIHFFSVLDTVMCQCFSNYINIPHSPIWMVPYHSVPYEREWCYRKFNEWMKCDAAWRTSEILSPLWNWLVQCLLLLISQLLCNTNTSLFINEQHILHFINL